MEGNRFTLLPNYLYRLLLYPDRKIGIMKNRQYTAILPYLYLIIEDDKIRLHIDEQWCLFEKSKTIPHMWKFSNIRKTTLHGAEIVYW